MPYLVALGVREMAIFVINFIIIISVIAINVIKISGDAGYLLTIGL